MFIGLAKYTRYFSVFNARMIGDISYQVEAKSAKKGFKTRPNGIRVNGPT